MSSPPRNTAYTRSAVAAAIDHTLLDPAATTDQVVAFLAEAGELNVGAVCVSPCMLPVPDELLDEGIELCTVVGFPSGAVDPRIKGAEAALAYAAGATEIDMVVNLGLVKGHDWDGVETDIAEVRAAVPGALLKVILETGALTDDEIVTCCRIAEAAEADFVKTSTGFHPSGGATIHAVELLAATVDGRLGVKASGGIRDAATAVAMLDAGATRLGTSAGKAILEGLTR